MHAKIVFNNKNMNSSTKLQWKDELLNIFNMPNEKYSPKEIENYLKNNFLKKGFLSFDNNYWEILKIPGWKKRIRLSYFMNHIIHKFIIKNDKPNSKYFYNELEFIELDPKQLNQIVCCL
jgi:hypothetical protein